MAPSKNTDIMPQTVGKNMPQDFIGDLKLINKYSIFTLPPN